MSYLSLLLFAACQEPKTEEPSNQEPGEDTQSTEPGDTEEPPTEIAVLSQNFHQQLENHIACTDTWFYSRVGFGFFRYVPQITERLAQVHQQVVWAWLHR